MIDFLSCILGEPISSLCYSHNGSHLLTGLSNGKVKVFEVSDFGIISPIFTLSNSKVSFLIYPTTASII